MRVIGVAIKANLKKGSPREEWRLGRGCNAGVMEWEERLDPSL